VHPEVSCFGGVNYANSFVIMSKLPYSPAATCRPPMSRRNMLRNLDGDAFRIGRVDSICACGPRSVVRGMDGVGPAERTSNWHWQLAPRELEAGVFR